MKKFVLLIMMCIICLVARGQATSLVVDNQTPGWLSSKINFSDQLTLTNLKVTGYVNETDLKFIGTLMQRSLKGTLDLTDASVVNCKWYDNDPDEHDDYIGNHGGRLMKGKLEHYLLPKSLKQKGYTIIYLSEVLDKIAVDTLTIGGNNKVLFGNERGDISYGTELDNVNLVIRDGVQEIWDGDLVGYSGSCSLSSIYLPKTLKYIGCRTFDNHTKLQHVNLPDSLEFIGIGAFANDSVFSDTVRLPKSLKSFYIGSFSATTSSVTQKNFTESESGYTRIAGSVNYYTYNGFPNVNVYIPESVTYIADCDTMHYQSGQKRGTEGVYQQREFNIMFGYIGYKNVWHIDSPIPPILNCKYSNLKSLTIYVPKGCVDAYKKAGYGDATILEEPILPSQLMLNRKEVKLATDSISSLIASILPKDADTKEVEWTSGNFNIAKVTDKGVIKGISSGRTYIYAWVKGFPNIKDSCLVIVYRPVRTIQLNHSEKAIKVGEAFNLTATIVPSNADDKSVIWTSSNDSIATVTEGKVTGVKAGTVMITATSVSNSNVMSQCAVTVLQPVEGIKLDKNFYQLNNIGETVQLTATVLPKDASNKTVNWKSTAEGVCYVSNGKVVAVGYGTAIIIATTVDGGFMDVCKIQVPNVTGIDNIHLGGEESSYQIYTMDGRKIDRLQKGVNIVRQSNGKTRKIVIK